MARSMFNPRQLAAGALLMGAMFASATPTSAQEPTAGGRMRVLIPPFLNAEGKITRAGERLADQLRRQVNQMPTHAATDMKDAEAQMKKFGVKIADMTCITWKQLASQMNGVGLVLCGTIDEASSQLTANFEPVGGGADPFKVQPFAMTSPEQGAQQIVQAFGTYVRGLSLALNCKDYIENQSWQQALDNCNQALEINPTSLMANYARGMALLSLERPEEALEGFKKVLSMDPLNQDALMAAGYTASRLGQADVSIGYFNQYLELNPGDEGVRLTIAQRLATQGDPAAALTLIEQVTTKDGASRNMMTYAGHFAMNAAAARAQAGPANGNNEEAIGFLRRALTSYEKALQMSPADSVDPVLLRQMMAAYRGLQNQEKALEFGARATAATGADAQTWVIYSDVLKDAGRIEEAVAALDKAGQMDPALPMLAMRKGMLQVEAGNLEAGVAALKQAKEQGSLSADVAEQVAQSITVKGYQETQAGRHERALAHYAAARDLGTSERSIAMANFFNGLTLLRQADPIIREGNNAASARRAKPLFERAKALLESSAAFTEQAALRGQMIAQANQFIEFADALIKQGR